MIWVKRPCSRLPSSLPSVLSWISFSLFGKQTRWSVVVFLPTSILTQNAQRIGRDNLPARKVKKYWKMDTWTRGYVSINIHLHGASGLQMITTELKCPLEIVGISVFVGTKHRTWGGVSIWRIAWKSRETSQNLQENSWICRFAYDTCKLQNPKKLRLQHEVQDTDSTNPQSRCGVRCK